MNQNKDHSNSVSGQGGRGRRRRSSTADHESESSSDEEAGDLSQSQRSSRVQQGDGTNKSLTTDVEADQHNIISKEEESGQITEEGIYRIREKLQKNLHEEQMLVSLQMQLLTQLERLNTSISEAESEERLGKLALQQGQIARALKRCQNPESNAEEDPITVQLR